jgi:hypothetical protein
VQHDDICWTRKRYSSSVTKLVAYRMTRDKTVLKLREYIFQSFPCRLAYFTDFDDYFIVGCDALQSYKNYQLFGGICCLSNESTRGVPKRR